VGLLLWLNLEACKERFGASDISVLMHLPALRDALKAAFRAHNAHHTGSSMRIRRVLILGEPASLDAGEITDKGYVNQRAVLARRADMVEVLYADNLQDNVVSIDDATV